jgi:hypothetical protein
VIRGSAAQGERDQQICATATDDLRQSDRRPESLVGRQSEDAQANARLLDDRTEEFQLVADRHVVQPPPDFLSGVGGRVAGSLGVLSGQGVKHNHEVLNRQDRLL